MVVLLVFVGTRATTRAVSNWYIDGANPLRLFPGDDDDIEDEFPFSTTTTTTTTMEFMRDGNEDEIDDTGRTAFETLRAMEKITTTTDDDEDDEDDEENDDRDDDDDEKEEEKDRLDVLQRTIIVETMVKKSLERRGRREKRGRLKRRRRSVRTLPARTCEDVVVLAFQGAKRSEGQANQRIYLVRSEDGGRTFDSRNPKKLNALVVQTVNGGEKKVSLAKRTAAR